MAFRLPLPSAEQAGLAAILIPSFRSLDVSKEWRHVSVCHTVGQAQMVRSAANVLPPIPSRRGRYHLNKQSSCTEKATSGYSTVDVASTLDEPNERRHAVLHRPPRLAIPAAQDQSKSNSEKEKRERERERERESETVKLQQIPSTHDHLTLTLTL